MSKLHTGLNKQVANLSVFFVKLHHHHWYVKGYTFYKLHEKFEEFYDEVNELYDALAERLLMVGGKPYSTLKDNLAHASIKEAKGGEKMEEMVEETLNDYKLLQKEFYELIKLGQEEGDEITVDLLIGAVSNFDKHIWMLSAFLGK
ncbi:MAG: Dps family protein [Bacilli bacterium]|jgi:starvation-inducible DNA-binding protein|nr:Dps family protein [Bacilli bacterium]